MNLYDFDDTIYDGDSGVDLVFYSLAKHPFLVLFSISRLIPNGILYLLKKRRVEDLKDVLFSFLYKMDNLEGYIEKFIDKKIPNIKKWYLDTQREDDIIISASNETWVIPFCKRLNIKYVMGTRVDDKGKIIGNNCSKYEKIIRLKEVFPNAVIEKSFSDSRKDIPILDYAKEAYVVKGKKLIKYENGYFNKRH